jgi:hypothetical protein
MLTDEQRALAEMQRVFGEEYPTKGMLMAMGTHSLYPDTWLINGVVRLDEVEQFWGGQLSAFEEHVAKRKRR